MKKNRGVIFLFVFFILVVFTGLRGDIEPDYINYLDIYNTSNWYDYFGNLSTEIGYHYYNVFLKEIGVGFQFVIFSMAFVTILLKLLFLKKYSDQYIISFILYYCSLFFLYEFIAIRQALAMSILMFSIPYIEDRKLNKFLFCIFVASLFHISAIITIPIYFIITKRYNNLILFALLLFCLGLNLANVSFPLINILSSFIPLPAFTLAKLQHYSMETEYAFVSIRLLLFAFIFLIYKWFNKEEEKYNLFFNLFVVGIIFSTLFNEIPQFSYRIKAYFLWTDILLWVYIVERICKKYVGLKIVSYGIIVGIYTLTLIGFLQSVSERGNYIYPYKFFWET